MWRSRWDSLTLFTPAQYSSLPGMAFPSPKDTYPSKDDVASYLESYVSEFDLPVKLNAKVTSLTKAAGEFVVTTADEELTADQVVVATGPFQVPFVPPVAGDLDDTVFQIHSADYRNPTQLPDGDVLVVGGGNSGFQIAEELACDDGGSRSPSVSAFPLCPQRSPRQGSVLVALRRRVHEGEHRFDDSAGSCRRATCSSDRARGASGVPGSFCEGG